LVYLLNSISVTIDKYLLVKQAPNPFFYIYYISLFSLLVLVGLPFVPIPNPTTFWFASLSTLLWTSGAYFMFQALKVGNPARVIPVIGTLIPIILAGMGYISGNLTLNQLWAIIILVLGLFCLVIPYLKGKLHTQEILSVLVSSLFFANSYVILAWAYQSGDFASVFVYSRIILIPFLLTFYLVGPLKKRFLDQGQHASPLKFFSRGGILFLFGQFAGGASQLLLTFSISLADPALVNAMQGVQYIFLFIFGLILAKKLPTLFGEKLSVWLWMGKILGIILITLGLFVLSMTDTSRPKPQYGVTFSPRYATELGLDPKESYVKMLSQLSIPAIRLPLYWNEFEPTAEQFQTEDFTFYLNEAEKANFKVIVALGYKAPRWPECYPPDWARNLSREQLQEKILLMLHKAVVTYKDHPAVAGWQVENEPFLAFGDCPAQNPLTFDFVKKEIALVKSLDHKPILVTDSGEISSWMQAMKLGDYFGTTMYRQVWNPYFGWFDYPLPAFFYNAKSWFVQKLVGVSGVNVIVSELQAEPWVPSQQSLTEWNIDEQFKTFPPEKIKAHLEFAQSTGFSEIYLWGVEWWLWMDKNGYPEYLNIAGELFDPHR
jgi:drug/metabolite transporter (DMT)-like permease